MRLLCDQYTHHADAGDSSLSVVEELHLWCKRLQRLDKRPAGPLGALATCPSSMFPVLQKLLQIMATHPVVTSTSESFSTSRRLKPYLPNTTGAPRLNELALLNMHREVPVFPNEISDQLAMKPQQLDIKP